MYFEPDIKSKNFSETESGEIVIFSWGNEEILAFIYDDIKNDDQQFKGFIRIQSLNNGGNFFDYIPDPKTDFSVFSLEKKYKIQFNPFDGFTTYYQGRYREIPGVLVVTSTSNFLCVKPTVIGRTPGFYNLNTGRMEGAPKDVDVGFIFKWKISILGFNETDTKPANEISFSIEKPK